ncbi:hypothetical protein ACROYT_G044026 [Oculina patagonica]
MILYPKGLYTYAMGNTRARDMTELLGTSKEQDLDLLLLACGDVRNVLCTVYELSLRKPHERPKSLNFHLNDYDPSVVARNAVILEVASVTNPDIQTDIDFLWNIWYNLALSKSHFDRLRKILSGLLEKNFESDESVLKFQNNAVLRECRDIWRDWLDLDLEVNSVKEDRNRLIDEKRRESKFDLDIQCFSVLTQMMMASNAEDEDILLTTPANPFYTEIKHWFNKGSTSDESDKTNPTLIRPFVHKWKQHYASCAFEGYLPTERQELKRCKTLTAACKEKLTLAVKRFQQQKKNYPATLKVTMWTGDALGLCTSGFPPELLFDVIDTSNVSDHIGLLNVLICCAPRLKVPNTSLLYTSSMLWSQGCQNIGEYYYKSIGVPLQLLPTVLGLKLAVDLDLGSKKLPDRIERTEEILCWVKADDKRTMLTVDKTSEAVQALVRLAERCFDLLNQEADQVLGVTLSSPLTFLRIIHQIQPLFKGGATQIFELLESALPADFNRKFGLSWNLLKASVGSEREPIVEIKASINISIASWYKGTPVPMICIAEENNLKHAKLLWLLGLAQSVEPPFSALYNSLRYDDHTHTVTFHLREKDWNELKSNSWMWTSSTDLIQVINREEVRLGDDTVKSVARVDPVDTFGLFSVQTFTVSEFNENCQILKVVKVEENTYSYSAELEILNSASCKPKAMKITFQPIKSPTQVHIHFDGAIGDSLNMYFSCPADEKTSKFQISLKRGIILCHIPKREDGTVGERVLENPAPFPYHALTLWDAKLHDIKICKRMFRTELDLDLKEQNASGSPFFNLRDSIFIILSKHVDESEMDGINNDDESMRKTTSCKKTSESPGRSSSLIGHKNIFVANQEVRVQTLLELVRTDWGELSWRPVGVFNGPTNYGNFVNVEC